MIMQKHQRSQVPHYGALRGFHVGNPQTELQINSWWWNELCCLNLTGWTRLLILPSGYTLPSMPHGQNSGETAPATLSWHLSLRSLTPLAFPWPHLLTWFPRNEILLFKEFSQQKNRTIRFLRVCFAFAVHLTKFQFFGYHDFWNWWQRKKNILKMISRCYIQKDGLIPLYMWHGSSCSAVHHVIYVLLLLIIKIIN